LPTGGIGAEIGAEASIGLTQRRLLIGKRLQE
jgi:hypothetical protein